VQAAASDTIAWRSVVPFHLKYRQDSFLLSEVYGSLNGAIGRASVVLEAGGGSELRIEENGVLLMSESEIVLLLNQEMPTTGQ
jgi:hypothetical protein